jgi:HK97 family phage major capsid protein
MTNFFKKYWLGILGILAVIILFNAVATFGVSMAFAMTLLEIKDQKTVLLDANDLIFQKADAEKRSLSEEENTTVNENLKKLQDLQTRENSELFKNNTGRIIQVPGILKSRKERFSLIDSINSVVQKRGFSDPCKDMNVLGMQEFRAAGVNHEGDIVIPYEVRADVLAQTATQGQEIVSEDKIAIMPPLVDKLIFSRAGVTFIPNCVGNVSFPNYAGTSVAWKDEVESAADGGGAFSEVEFAPKRLTGYVNVSKTFLAQDKVGAERLLMANIADAVARKLESTILGVAAYSSKQPQGMGYKITTGADTKANAAVPTWATMVGLETSVDTSNALQENLAYITNGTCRGFLKTIYRVATYGEETLLLPDGTMNGYPVLVTNAASTIAGDDDTGELIVFGNWKDLYICQWGGYDITVDPYTLAKTNQVQLVINAYFDAKGIRGSASTDVHSVTQADQYAKSFASLALKAS